MHSIADVCCVYREVQCGGDCWADSAQIFALQYFFLSTSCIFSQLVNLMQCLPVITSLPLSPPLPSPPLPSPPSPLPTPAQILWTFSIYLESLAILPQLFMITKTGEAETITSHYLFALGSYRTLYIVNWVWRYYNEGFYDIIAIVAGCVQTLLYLDFFYLYITKGEG